MSLCGANIKIFFRVSGTATRQNLMQSRQGGGEWLRIGRENMGRRIQSCVPKGDESDEWVACDGMARRGRESGVATCKRFVRCAQFVECGIPNPSAAA